jgi:hypothetical protein
LGWVRVRRSLSVKVREVMVVSVVPRVIVVVFVRAGKGVGVIGGYAGIVWIWLLLFVGMGEVEMSFDNQIKVHGRVQPVVRRLFRMSAFSVT